MKIRIIDTDTGTELLTSSMCADLADVTVGTWSGYVARGQAPAAIAHLNARTPLWNADEVQRWATTRPGRGARTDLGAHQGD